MKCNLKYTLVAAALCLTAGAAQAQQATVSVTGRITNTACTLSVDNVVMGDVPISEYLSASIPSTAYRKNFNINLGGCQLSTLTSATLKFSGTTVNDTQTLAIPAGTGVAQGFGVRIVSNDSFHSGTATTVTFGSTNFPWNLASNRSVYQFQAYYYKYGTTAKPGTANATATVTLTYA